MPSGDVRVYDVTESNAFEEALRARPPVWRVTLDGSKKEVSSLLTYLLTYYLLTYLLTD